MRPHYIVGRNLDSSLQAPNQFQTHAAEVGLAELHRKGINPIPPDQYQATAQYYDLLGLVAPQAAHLHTCNPGQKISAVSMIVGIPYNEDTSWSQIWPIGSDGPYSLTIQPVGFLYQAPDPLKPHIAGADAQTLIFDLKPILYTKMADWHSMTNSIAGNYWYTITAELVQPVIVPPGHRMTVATSLALLQNTPEVDIADGKNLDFSCILPLVGARAGHAGLFLQYQQPELIAKAAWRQRNVDISSQDPQTAIPFLTRSGEDRAQPVYLS